MFGLQLKQRLAVAACGKYWGHVIKRSLSRPSQIVCMASKPVDEVLEQLRANPFQDSYRKKIEAYINENQRMEDGVAVIDLSKFSTVAKENAAFVDSSRQDCSNGSSQTTTISNTVPDGAVADGSDTLDFVDESKLPSFAKPLGSILNLPALRDVDPIDIQKERLSAVVPSDTYNVIYARSQAAPRFLYPLPRKDGFELFLGMVQNNVVAFTSLAEYKRYQESAPPALTLYFYTELQRSKGIVLMMGEHDSDKLSMPSAVLLANQHQVSYGAIDDATSWNMVKTFNHSPEEFDLNSVIERFKDLFGDTLAGVATLDAMDQAKTQT